LNQVIGKINYHFVLDSASWTKMIGKWIIFHR